MWTRRRGIGIGVLAVALVLSGLSVGVSYGTTGPTTFTVEFGDVLAEHTYPLRDTTGRHTGGIDALKGRLLDADGIDIGRHRSECTSSDKVAWWCTHTLTLHAGPYTDEGTVTLSGLFKGFSGEEIAVVGGTGAYRGASGYATRSVDGGAFVITVSLS
jgi:hypothetical protein